MKAQIFKQLLKIHRVKEKKHTRKIRKYFKLNENEKNISNFVHPPKIVL